MIAPSGLAEAVAEIMEVAKAFQEVVGLDQCRVRKSGLVRFVDIHGIVDGVLSVSEGHRISHEVKAVLLMSGLGIREVAIHVEPSRSIGAGTANP